MTHPLATRFFDAIEAADVATLKTLYAPDATVWSNVSGRSIDARMLIAALPGMKKRMPDRAYVDRRVLSCDGGFVHTHRITGTRPDGAKVALSACAVVTVTDDRIMRVEEYLDSRQLDAVFAR